MFAVCMRNFLQYATKRKAAGNKIFESIFLSNFVEKFRTVRRVLKV